MRFVVVCFAIAGTLNSIGCNRESQSHTRVKAQNIELAAKAWAVDKLNLSQELLDEYYVTIDNDKSGNSFVQFAHRERMANSIMDCGAIEMCLGGFPDYFNVTIGRDLKTVVDHYASPE